MACCFQNKIRLCILCIFILSAGCTTNNRQIESYTLCDQDKALFQSGDIILRKGNGLLSEFITNYLADTLAVSHCGIIIRNNNDLQVVHSLSKSVSDTDGVQICTLDDFTKESIPNSIFVIRYKEDTVGRIASQALYYLQIHKPFDSKFDMQDSSAFFCSELPLHILKYALHSNLQIDYPYPKFSVFMDDAYFQVIHPQAVSIIK